MTTTTNPVPRDGPRDDAIGLQRWLRTDAVPIVKAWWLKQARQTQRGLVVAAVLALAGTFSLCASLSRPVTKRQCVSLSLNLNPYLKREPAPELEAKAEAAPIEEQ